MNSRKIRIRSKSTEVMLGVGLAGCAIAYCLLGADFWAWHIDGLRARTASRTLFPFFVITMIITLVSGSAVWRRYHGMGSILLFLGGLSVFLALLLPGL